DISIKSSTENSIEKKSEETKEKLIKQSSVTSIKNNNSNNNNNNDKNENSIPTITVNNETTVQNVKKERVTTITTTQTITTTTTTTVVESESVQSEYNKLEINAALEKPIENEIVSPSGSEKINLLKKIKSVPNIEDSITYTYHTEDNTSENNDYKEQSILVEEPTEDESQQKIDYLIYDVISGRAFSTDNKLIS
ncbi:hypothetical protein BCR32DRAFT_126159, partial [Anaeromyces robustus]